MSREEHWPLGGDHKDRASRGTKGSMDKESVKHEVCAKAVEMDKGSPGYGADVAYVAGLPLPWEKLDKKTVLITGASGMIGTFLIQVLLSRKEDIRVIGVGRDLEKAKARFAPWWDREDFQFLAQDINTPMTQVARADILIHAASNTHPAAYSSDPVGTRAANVLGTYQLLTFAAACKAERFLFASSVEVYGENRGDQVYFDEGYCGYIDCNTLRAGYPESKRAGEALCQAFIRQRSPSF